MKKIKIGLVGIGLMGSPMAKNWLKNGFPLTILPHKNLASAKGLKALGAQVAKSLEELASQSDTVVLMLPTSKEVEALTISQDSLKKYLKPNQICIDMTTSDPKSTRKIFEEFKKHNLRFIDAPVTGGVKGAVAGTLTLFIGGPMEWFKEVEDVLKAVSHVRQHFGKIGSGHIAKIINNYICIGNLAVFSEALPLSAKYGIDSTKMFETLISGIASSEMLKYYGPQILLGDFDPRFKLAHAYKDLRLAKKLSSEIGIKFPVLDGMLKDFSKAVKAGLSEKNLSALIKPIESSLKAKFRARPK